MTQALEQKIRSIIPLIDSIVQDTTVPRNIRRSLEEAKSKLQTNDDPIVKAGGVIYILEDIANDVNMPLHTRTQIWNILSALEGVKV